MHNILDLASKSKDFFWVIFTLVATTTSLLTYIRVRKSTKQPLFNKIIEEQLKCYSEILDMLKQSANEFLVSWDLDNIIKYNIISHLVDFGFLEDSEIALHIHECYMMMLNGLEIQVESLEDELNSIESLNLIIREDINFNKLKKEQHSASETNQTMDTNTPGRYTLLDIRGAFLNTPRSTKIFNILDAAKNNIYLPNKMLGKVSEFHEQVCNFMFREVFGIIRREEARIEEAVVGETITLDFDHIFNEIMQKGDYLKPEYHKLKKEIRKVLMIDTKW